MEVVKGPDSWEEKEIGRMVKSYEKELLRLCCVYLRDLTMAEDAVQETFLKAYKNLHRFRGESSEKTWLVRIAINVCKDMQRTAWFRNLGKMVALESVQLAQEQEMDVSSALTMEIMRLPQKDKEVVLLYYYEEMNQSEIAQVLGVSVTTVHRRLEKARRALRQQLEGGIEREA